MKVRLATASDEEALLEMGRRMHAESRFSRYPLDHTKLSKLIELSLSDEKVHCILVAQNVHGQLTGMLGGHVQSMFFTDALIAQDKFFYVLPEWRGTSAALKLLMAFQRWALNRRVQEININMSVAIDMERFDKFMRHTGFASCGSNYFKNTA